jgi:hypothetical protein
VNLDQQDRQWILDQLKATQRQTADLVTSVKESLEREMREGFERIEKVTTRHTGLIASGTLAISTLIKSSQKGCRDRQPRGADGEARGPEEWQEEMNWTILSSDSKTP